MAKFVKLTHFDYGKIYINPDNIVAMHSDVIEIDPGKEQQVTMLTFGVQSDIDTADIAVLEDLDTVYRLFTKAEICRFGD